MYAHTVSGSACMGYVCSYCIWQCLYGLYVTYISVLCVPLLYCIMLLFIFFTVRIIILCSRSLLLYGYCSNLYQHCQYYMIHSLCLSMEFFGWLVVTLEHLLLYTFPIIFLDFIFLIYHCFNILWVHTVYWMFQSWPLSVPFPHYYYSFC